MFMGVVVCVLLYLQISCGEANADKDKDLDLLEKHVKHTILLYKYSFSIIFYITCNKECEGIIISCFLHVDHSSL